MKLSEVFSQLATGELSQLNVVDSVTGEIAEAKYGQLVNHVNMGLTALYKRFLLKENRLKITLETSRINYPLNTDSTLRFGVETGSEDFEDDILKVERVYTDDEYELGLNDASDPYSCFNTSMTTIRVPSAIAGRSTDMPEKYLTYGLTVVYRANHPIIVMGSSFDPARVDLELPYSHLEPLIFYIASRVNNPIGMTNEFHAGNSYAAKYEKSCAEIESKNIQIDVGSQNDRLASKGWV